MLVIQLKKTDFDTNVNEIEKKTTDHSHDKYITTPEFNKLTAENFAASLAHANLVTNTDFDVKLSSLNKKVTSNKTNHLIVENEFNKLDTFDSIYFRGKIHFEDNDIQNFLVFQTVRRYFKTIRLVIVIFYHRNVKNCWMKVLSLLLHLIKSLILQWIMLILK